MRQRLGFAAGLACLAISSPCLSQCPSLGSAARQPCVSPALDTSASLQSRLPTRHRAGIDPRLSRHEPVAYSPPNAGVRCWAPIIAQGIAAAGAIAVMGTLLSMPVLGDDGQRLRHRVLIYGAVAGTGYILWGLTRWCRGEAARSTVHEVPRAITALRTAAIGASRH